MGRDRRPPLQAPLDHEERAALVAEHARLIETSHTLQVVAAELASVRDTDGLLQGIVDRALAALGADGCAVWLLDEARIPRLNATRGLSEEFHRRLAARHRRQIAAGTEAALAGQPIFERDVAAAVGAGDPEFAATLRREGLVSGLRLPLREPGGLVAGWLTLYHRRERLYGEEEVRLAQAFADSIAVALRNARLTEQEHAAREEAARRLEETAVLEERARLARDLHDSVTQSIFSVGMLARAAQTQHERGAPALGATLARVAELSQEALAEMRALLVTLRPVALDEEGLAGALVKLTESFQARSGIAIACHVETDARPTPDAETAIFRIVQEALANVAKHAQASEASVALGERDGLVTVTVSDNGRGFDPAPPRGGSPEGRDGGIGLRSMRERAAAAGIAIRLDSAPGAGATITLVAPVAAFDRAG